MSRAKAGPQRPAPIPRDRAGRPGRAIRRGRAWLAVAAAAVLALVGAFAWTKRDLLRPSARPPQADLSAVQGPVRGKVEAALAAVAADPRSASAWSELAMVYHAHAFLPEARLCYAEAARLDPAEPRWPYLEALALAPGDPEASLERLAAAQSLGAIGLAVDWHEGNLQAELGRGDAARRAFERGLAHDPESAPLRAGLGRLALQAGNLEAAVPDLEAAMRADPNWAESYVLLAQAYGRLGREGDAGRAAKLAQAAQQLEQLGPPDPVYLAVIERGVSVRWLVRRGQVAAQAGRIPEAEALFRQAITADPASPAGYLGLGATLQGRGDLAGAIGQYRQALEQRPQDVEALTNLGLALARSGKVEEGRALLEEALTLAPGHLGASLNLALVLREAGAAEAALATADQALRWQPEQQQLLEVRAGALMALERPAEAATAWQALAEAAPSNPQPLAQWASALMQAGEHAQALTLLRRGLSTHPGNTMLQASLAWELATAPDAALRDGVEAVALARSLLQGMPGSAQAQDVLATALAESGDWEGAVDAAEAAVAALQEGDPTGPQIRARLAAFRARQAFRQGEP